MAYVTADWRIDAKYTENEIMRVSLRGSLVGLTGFAGAALAFGSCAGIAPLGVQSVRPALSITKRAVCFGSMKGVFINRLKI
jgi:hypothetical protein